MLIGASAAVCLEAPPPRRQHRRSPSGLSADEDTLANTTLRSLSQNTLLLLWFHHRPGLTAPSLAHYAAVSGAEAEFHLERGRAPCSCPQGWGIISGQERCTDVQWWRLCGSPFPPTSGCGRLVRRWTQDTERHVSTRTDASETGSERGERAQTWSARTV